MDTVFATPMSMTKIVAMIIQRENDRMSSISPVIDARNSFSRLVWVLMGKFISSSMNLIASSACFVSSTWTMMLFATPCLLRASWTNLLPASARVSSADPSALNVPAMTNATWLSVPRVTDWPGFHP